MMEFTVYTTPFCGFCARAIDLLKSKRARVTEISAAYDLKKNVRKCWRAQMAKRLIRKFLWVRFTSVVVMNLWSWKGRANWMAS